MPQPQHHRYLLLVALLMLLAGCGSTAPAGESGPREVPGGNVEEGRRLVTAYGCGTCHTIPGVRGARATVGPPLDGFWHREFIAGALPNRPDELIRWLVSPQSVEPGSAMPDLGLQESEARDIAAYLYTLR